MSRLRFKGGAWTNSEDEVLRASLTVYGLQNWERVASMLVRKTATQCRERWESYLDPRLNIREEWTADEESRLVQLQSLFPNQWNLISREMASRGGMNRPAWLCEEHYHTILDALEYAKRQQQRADNTSLEDFVAERKRQRATQLGHETKPARADTTDAESFEKEMVEFAVSRLANQDGKKGLRKERKKQLEHTSFLAKLQSNREAIESGTLSARAKKKMDRAMLEDLTGPTGARIQDTTVERKGNDEDGADGDDVVKQTEAFRPMDLVTDKESAGIQAKQRVLIKDLDTRHQQRSKRQREEQQGSAAEGVDLASLLRLAGGPADTQQTTPLLEGQKRSKVEKKSLTMKEVETTTTTVNSALAERAPTTVDLDGLFATLPDIVDSGSSKSNNNNNIKSSKARGDVPMQSGGGGGGATLVDDLLRGLPELKAKGETLSRDSSVASVASSSSSFTSDATGASSGFVAPIDFTGEEGQALLREAKRRVLVVAEMALVNGPNSQRDVTSLSHAPRSAFTSLGSSTTVKAERNNFATEVEDYGEDELAKRRIVEALIENQMSDTARYLLSESHNPRDMDILQHKQPRIESQTDPHANDHRNNNNDDDDDLGSGSGEGRKRDDNHNEEAMTKEEVSKRLAALVAEVADSPEGAELWRSVSAAEATVQLEELVEQRREQLAVVKEKNEAAQHRLRRIVSVCFGDDGEQTGVDDEQIIKRACTYWGAELMDAQRRLEFYTNLQKMERIEIRRRVEAAAQRLAEVEEEERKLQELYRTMGLSEEQ